MTEKAFSEIVSAHRQELQRHCYRMVRSVEDAEDLVQETFLRAWRSRSTSRGRSSQRAWLYRIATNACYDAMARRGRRTQPAPAELFERLASSDPEPEAAILAKETFELLFLLAIRLPPKQAAALILRCAAGLSAKETAAALEANVSSVNSALQRARGTLRDSFPEQGMAWEHGPDPVHEERVLVERLVDAAVPA